jgi:hypothetical protein
MVMALTLEKLLRLQSVEVTGFFKKERAKWLTASRRAYQYVKEGFAGQEVRIDDCATPLAGVVTIDPTYRAFRSKKRLKEKYWIVDFAEYVLDQTWDEISKE